MKVTTTLTEPALRFVDDHRGEYPMHYDVTVTADVTDLPDEYVIEGYEVVAVDRDGDVESWDWHSLSSREQADADAGLIAACVEARTEAAMAREKAAGGRR